MRMVLLIFEYGRSAWKDTRCCMERLLRRNHAADHHITVSGYQALHRPPTFKEGSLPMEKEFDNEVKTMDLRFLVFHDTYGSIRKLQQKIIRWHSSNPLDKWEVWDFVEQKDLGNEKT